MRRNLFLAVLLAVAIAASPAAAAQPFERITAHVLAAHVLPGLKRFGAATKALAAALRTHEQVPTALSFDAARSAFHGAVDAWQGVQHLRRGPAEAEFRHQRVQFWPDKRGHTRKHLAQLLATADAGQLAPAVFAKQSVAVQGFPALERILFGKSLPAGFALDVAVAIADNIAAIANELESAWGDTAKGFGALMAHPGPTNPMFADAKAVAGFLSTELATGLRAVDELKLRRVVGKSGPAHPKRAENWRSERSLRNVRVNLTALSELFGAMVEGATLSGEDRARADSISGQFAVAIHAARALGSSMTAAADERGVLRLRGLAASVEDLYELAAGFFAEVMDLTMGFNSLDGD